MASLAAAGSAALAQRLLARALEEPAPAEQRDRLLLWLGRAEHQALDLDAAREHLGAARASDHREVALSAAGGLFDGLDHAHEPYQGGAPAHPRLPDVEDLPAGESERVVAAVR